MGKFADVISFGGIDADADDLLDQCFQDHEAYKDCISHAKPFIIGRKGSGKTAIFKKIIQTKSFSSFSFGHTFSDYPWHHHKLQELVGVPDELRYVQSWQYLILLTAAKILLNQDQSQPWDDESSEQLARLEKFVTDSYGSRDPDVSQLFTPSKRLRIKPHLTIAKDLVKFGLDLESLPVSDLPKVVQEVNNNISNAVIKSLNPDCDYFICFDELDRGFDPASPSYTSMLVGLMLAAKHLNSLARKENKRFSVVIFLRDDIYHLLKFEDKNKITESLISRVEWDSPRTRWTLKQLMEKRFSAVISGGEPCSWENVFDEESEMTGHQKKYQYILDRTFKRPRDIIKFCNETLKAFKNRGAPENSLFLNEDIISARVPYSEYFLAELSDEIFKHIPGFEKHLDLFRSLSAAQFSREEFQDVCARRAELLSDGQTWIDVLRQQFDFSVLAYQKTGGVGGGSEYIWKHQDPKSRFDESALNFKIHPGLIEVLGLKRHIKRAEG